MAKYLSCSCYCCGDKSDDETKEVETMDLAGRELTDVPSYIFLYERTLEELLLTSNRIKDLPLPLFHCESLTTLMANNNYIEILPPAISFLVNLEFLDVSRNCISSISDNIKSCKKLKRLNLSMNPIGQFPEGLTQLINLEVLLMCSTMIEYIPANIGRLANLRVLEVRDNVISALPKAFARLTNLTNLDIGQNDFSELPEPIGELRSLEYLYIEGNEIEDLPPFISGMESLSYLDGVNTEIRLISKNLGELTRLVYLYLSNAKLKAIPVTIGRLKSLIFLRLDGNLLQSLPPSIGHLPNLEQLYLGQNRLENIPFTIGLLRKLQFLDLSSNFIKELPPEIGSCVNLRILILQDNLLKNVPAEIGNLAKLKVCNLISNRLKNLPMSVLKLRKLKALWLSPNQVKPMNTLVREYNQETNRTVLTCYLLPQTDYWSDDLRNFLPQENRNNSNSNCGEHHQSRPRIRFSTDSFFDRQSHLLRTPTPYPRRSRSFTSVTGSSQRLESDDEEIPVVNLPNNRNRGEEVRVAVVKKPVPSQSETTTSASSSNETPSQMNVTNTLQPPPYHIAAMKSKHAPYFESTTTSEGLPDNEAIMIVEDAFRKSLPSSETSDSPQSENSGDSSGMFSKYINQNLFVNQNLLDSKGYQKKCMSNEFQEKFEEVSESYSECLSAGEIYTSSSQGDINPINKFYTSSSRGDINPINKLKPNVEEVSENTSAYLSAEEICTSNQVAVDDENEGLIQCTAEVHQFSPTKEKRNDCRRSQSILSSTITLVSSTLESNWDEIVSLSSTSPTTEESVGDNMIALKGNDRDNSTPSSEASVLKGDDGHNLASTSSTTKGNYNDFNEVVGGRYQQLSAEPKSVEARALHTSTIKPMNFCPEKESSSEKIFEKKPRPCDFENHQNASLISIQSYNRDNLSSSSLYPVVQGKDGDNLSSTSSTMKENYNDFDGGRFQQLPIEQSKSVESRALKTLPVTSMNVSFEKKSPSEKIFEKKPRPCDFENHQNASLISIQSYNRDNLSSSSLYPVVQGNEGDNLSSTSSTMKENYNDFDGGRFQQLSIEQSKSVESRALKTPPVTPMNVSPEKKSPSEKIFEKKPRPCDFENQQNASLISIQSYYRDNLSSSSLYAVVQGNDGDNLSSTSSTMKENYNDFDGDRFQQLSIEQSKSVESRALKTPPVTPMNVSPEKKSSSDKIFEKKPRPCDFENHQNASLISIQSYNRDNLSSSSLYPVVQGNDGDNLSSTSSTMKENYNDFDGGRFQQLSIEQSKSVESQALKTPPVTPMNVSPEKKSSSDKIFEKKPRPCDFENHQSASLISIQSYNRDNLSSSSLYPVVQGNDGDNLSSTSSTMKENYNDFDGGRFQQLSIEQFKSVESRALKTPPVTPMNVSPEKKSPSEKIFEKKPRPWVFGNHKNATVIEVLITKNNSELGFTLEAYKSVFFVADVNPGTPAGDILRRGDKILQVDGINLDETMKLEELMSILEDFTRPFSMMISRI